MSTTPQDAVLGDIRAVDVGCQIVTTESRAAAAMSASVFAAPMVPNRPVIRPWNGDDATKVRASLTTWVIAATSKSVVRNAGSIFGYANGSVDARVTVPPVIHINATRTYDD